jgi:FkbM family methyltransferase
MIKRQLRLTLLLSVRENSMLVLRKIVSYIFPDTGIAREILKEKRALDRLLSQGLKINYDGAGNRVEVNLENRLVLKASLRRYSSDFMVFDQILNQQEYQPLVHYVKKYNSETSILSIVDAGANIGLTALYLKVFFQDAIVYCIEPDLSNYKTLCKNLKLNHVDHHKTIRAAVWHRNEMVSLSNNFRDGKDWSISVENSGEGSDSVNKVKGVTIAELMMQNNLTRIDILKIDIEGAERYLFSSIQTAESFLPFTKYLAMEIHEEFGILDKVKQILEHFGFEYFFAGELIIARNKKLADI